MVGQGMHANDGSSFGAHHQYERTKNAGGRDPPDAMHGHGTLRELRKAALHKGYSARIQEGDHESVGEHSGDHEGCGHPSEKHPWPRCPYGVDCGEKGCHEAINPWNKWFSGWKRSPQGGCGTCTQGLLEEGWEGKYVRPTHTWLEEDSVVCWSWNSTTFGSRQEVNWFWGVLGLHEEILGL
jgi:hypothetical protein